MQNRVLIIEDARSFALLIQRLLQETHSIESDVAFSLEDARKYIAQQPSKYFAAIVDLHLPDAQKGEAIDFAVASHIPVMVFTGTEDHDYKHELWDKGIADYAHKDGAHSLEYVTWSVNRLRKNAEVEVLVVDDSLVARKSMAKLLKTQRFTVHSASNGEKALSLLTEHPGICVAIVDCFMDGMDGFELSSLMRENRNRESLEIIGVSSGGGRSLPAQFIKSGANDFLIKPFNPEEFLCRVNHAVDRVENYQELKALNLTKNELLGTAAHDIRGPVGAIKTAADYILRRSPTAERQQSLLEMIEKSASGLLDLLSDLLDVSAIESGEVTLKLSKQDLVMVVQERESLYRAEAEAKNMCITMQSPTSLVAQFDPVKLRQVIDNLLTNAIKYSPIGGKIQITLEDQGETFELSVQDSGPGVSENEQQELFKPFKTLSNQVTGGEKATGLGLAIASNVIRAHQGEISYQNGQPSGACFSITLPKYGPDLTG